MDKLTTKQQELYDAIKEYIEEWGYSPTIRELCKITHKKSPSSVCAMLKILKRKGCIDYTFNYNRTIRVLNNEQSI